MTSRRTTPSLFLGGYPERLERAGGHGIQYFVAVNNRAEVIITRNLRDHLASTIPVMTPSQFIAAFHHQG